MQSGMVANGCKGYQEVMLQKVHFDDFVNASDVAINTGAGAEAGGYVHFICPVSDAGHTSHRPLSLMAVKP